MQQNLITAASLNNLFKDTLLDNLLTHCSTGWREDPRVLYRANGMCTGTDTEQRRVAERNSSKWAGKFSFTLVKYLLLLSKPLH